MSRIEPGAWRDRLWSYFPASIQVPSVDELDDQINWRKDMRSRWTASMGVPYHNAGLTYGHNPFEPVVQQLAEVVGARFGFLVNNCLLNRYGSGQSTLGWHADDVSIMAPDTPIVIVSVGATRRLVLRRTLENGEFERIALPLEHGSVLVMTMGLQRSHKHGFRKEPDALKRISLTFRQLTHSPPASSGRPRRS